MRSSHDPTSHVMGAEVGTFVNFLSLPKGRGQNQGNSVKYQAYNLLILNYERMLQSHDNN